MAINRKPIFIGIPFSLAANTTVGAVIDRDTNLATVTPIQGSADGCVLQDLNVVNTAATAKAVNVIFNNGSIDLFLGRVAIPASAGSSTTPAVSLLNGTDIPSLNKRDDGSILLFSNQSFKVGAVAQLEVGQELHIVPLGGNLTA
jgi:hypothetical protein